MATNGIIKELNVIKCIVFFSSLVRYILCLMRSRSNSEKKLSAYALLLLERQSKGTKIIVNKQNRITKVAVRAAAINRRANKTLKLLTAVARAGAHCESW